MLALSPGATRTEFFDVVGTEDVAGGASMQTPQQVVKTAMTTLDRRNPPPSIISGRLNRAVSALINVMPRRTAVNVMGRVTKSDGTQPKEETLMTRARIEL
jgi:short-subunit dehydrogenase